MKFPYQKTDKKSNDSQNKFSKLKKIINNTNYDKEVSGDTLTG